VAMAGVGAAPPWLIRTAAQNSTKRKILVAIFQRGAADGLNMVVPFFEKRYYDLRPTIAVPEPGKPNGAIDLDGRFALHPSLRPLKGLWDTKQLAIIEATGSPDPSRSHFDAQDFMESGTPGKTRDDGWLNRALPARGQEPASPLRAVALGTQLPRTLRGPQAAVAISNLEQFQTRNQTAADILETMYSTSGGDKLGAAGKETFEAIRMIEAINRGTYIPANGAQYQGQFGQSLQQIARLIKADV